MTEEAPLIELPREPDPWISPTKAWDLCSPERQRNLRVAWTAGNLRWKLDPSQQRIYDDIYASHRTVKSSAERIYCMDVSRQSGKDFTMSTIAVETCIRRRCATRIPYAAPTKDNVKELLVPTMMQLFQDCPPELLPMEIKKGTFQRSAHTLTWPWGARIVLVGVDLHPDWLRGPATYAFMFTEPAFVDNLEDLMGSVLLPQMLTQPQGFGIMGSTPPVTPSHAWSTKYIPEAKARGMYSMRTIQDCPRFSREQKDGFIRELGGMGSNRVRRELFCEHIVDSERVVIPEMAEVKNEIVVDSWPEPEYRDTYVSIDPGFAHATGAVFGYEDFKSGLFIIEGDLYTQGKNSREVARAIKAREWQLWGREPVKPKGMTDAAWAEELALTRSLFYRDLPARKAPVRSFRNGQILSTTYKRVSDTDARLICDLSREHDLNISATDKDEMEAAINNLRIKIQSKRYRILSRCTFLIAQLEQATWNKARTKLAESPGGGHFDTVPAMVYLNRNITTRNPFPPHLHSTTTHHVPKGARTSSSAQALSQLFRGRKR